jgi:hypothetical protein
MSMDSALGHSLGATCHDVAAKRTASFSFTPSNSSLNSISWPLNNALQDTMATTIASTAATAQFNQLLSDFKTGLSQDEIHNFNFFSSTDLKKSILSLQEDQKSEKRMRNLRRLSAFVEAMDQFDKVVHVFLNATNYLGFIWVGFL